MTIGPIARRGARARRHALPALLLVAAACGGRGPLPPFTVPQFEGAREAVEGGLTKRYEDHAACRKTATDALGMVTCMKAAGYGYVERSGDPQVRECWRLRDTNAADPPPEVTCFVRAAVPAR